MSGSDDHSLWTTLTPTWGAKRAMSNMPLDSIWSLNGFQDVDYDGREPVGAAVADDFGERLYLLGFECGRLMWNRRLFKIFMVDALEEGSETDGEDCQVTTKWVQRRQPPAS